MRVEFELTLELRELLAQLQHLELRAIALLGQLQRHRQFLLREGQAACQGLFAGLEVVHLLTALFDLLADAVEGRLELALPRLEQRALALRNVGAVFKDVRREDDVAALRLRRQARDLAFQRHLLGAVLAQLRLEAGGVDAQQDLALLDHLALADQHVGEDAAFQVLDHLDLRRRDDLAHADRDFIDMRVRGPAAEGGDEQGDDKEEQGRGQRRPRGRCRAQVGQERLIVGDGFHCAAPAALTGGTARI